LSIASITSTAICSISSLGFSMANSLRALRIFAVRNGALVFVRLLFQGRVSRAG
jgi:hypothetical protein